MEQSSLIALFVLLFGLSIGSFLNVLIYRVPNGLSITSPASHCPNCNNPLRWYHNIPLLSWLALGGKCAYCKSKISIKYPLVEILNALIWIALYLRVGLEWYAPFIMLSFSMLLTLSLIDIKYFAVPDSLNFAALLFALIQPNFFSHLTDAAFAALGLWLLGKLVSIAAKKEALGEADIIVAGTMAALLGFPAFFIAIFLAAILAILPSLLAKDTMVPFVPFLAMATLITYLNNDALIHFIKVIIYV